MFISVLEFRITTAPSRKMAYVYVLATLPGLVHLYASFGVLSGWKYPAAQRDSLQWWLDSTVECYRLGPSHGKFRVIVAYLQLLVAMATLTIHLLKMFKLRTVMYYLLLAAYVCTQMRHLLFGSGVYVIGYLFTHMLIYMILVMYYETRIKNLKL